MRRRLVWLARGTLVAGLLAGCGATTDLTAKWPMLPAATIFVPPVGQCWDTSQTDLAPEYVYQKNLRVMGSCDEQHSTETVFVGEFPPDVAGRSSPPISSDLAVVKIVQDACDKAATDYLGGEWRGSLTSMLPFLPSPDAWAGGYHGYRCDLLTVQFREGAIGSSVGMRRGGSVRDGLRGARPLGLACADVTTNAMIQRACAEPHSAEFAGIALVAVAGVKWEDDRVGAACEPVVAKYLGMSLSQYTRRLDVDLTWVGSADPYVLVAANRQPRALCFASVADKHKIHGSLAGIGTKKLPA